MLFIEREERISQVDGEGHGCAVSVRPMNDNDVIRLTITELTHGNPDGEITVYVTTEMAALIGSMLIEQANAHIERLDDEFSSSIGF